MKFSLCFLLSPNIPLSYTKSFPRDDKIPLIWDYVRPPQCHTFEFLPQQISSSRIEINISSNSSNGGYSDQRSSKAALAQIV
jgi:hypothetical protein